MSIEVERYRFIRGLPDDDLEAAHRVLAKLPAADTHAFNVVIDLLSAELKAREDEPVPIGRLDAEEGLAPPPIMHLYRPDGDRYPCGVARSGFSDDDPGRVTCPGCREAALKPGWEEPLDRHGLMPKPPSVGGAFSMRGPIHLRVGDEILCGGQRDGPVTLVFRKATCETCCLKFGAMSAAGDLPQVLHHYQGESAGFACGSAEPGHSAANRDRVTCPDCLGVLSGLLS